MEGLLSTGPTCLVFTYWDHLFIDSHENPLRIFNLFFHSYGKPGDLITVHGEFFTKEYGNANWLEEEGGQDNRREESVTGVVVGDRECELTDPLGNM